MWMVQAQKRLSLDASYISKPVFKTFVEKMTDTSRKTVTVKIELRTVYRKSSF